MQYGTFIFAAMVACMIHAYKTDQERWWFFVLLLAPGLGTVAYALLVLIPQWRGSYGGRRTLRKVGDKIAPERQRERLSNTLKVADTVENRIGYAEESLRLGDFATALAHFEAVATGVFADDQRILIGLAQAHFGLGNHQACQNTLDRLIAAHPDFKSPDCHLLYARCLTELGDLNQAAGEYEILRLSYPGEEARVRYAEVLLQLGRKEQAKELLQYVLDRSKGAPAYYRTEQKTWLQKAKSMLDTIDP